MGSALRNTPVLDLLPGDSIESAEPEVRALAADLSSATDSAEALRQLASERLAAHRGRRQRLDPAAASETTAHSPRTSRIAATVAARYANSISYRAYLAAEAERSIQEAQAAAEVARLNAQAIVEAQQRLLDDLSILEARAELELAQQAQALEADLSAESSLLAETASLAVEAVPITIAPLHDSLWPEEPRLDENAGGDRRSAPQRQPQPRPKTSAREPRIQAADAAPKLTEPDLFTPALKPDAASAPSYTVRLGGEALQASSRPVLAVRITAESDHEMSRALDEEISFRQAPVFEAPPDPPMPLPANLIEFPRQLIASRKARPRIAEGPLREEADASPSAGQLRIFEVEPAHISIIADPAAESTGELQWSSILLEGAAKAHAAFVPSSHPRPQPAPLGRRSLSAAVDLAVITGALAASALALSVFLIHQATGAPAGAALSQVPGAALDLLRSPERALVIGSALAGFVLLWVVYQLACFTFSDATLGMRYTRIALCTLTDENPTRAEMRRRIPMLLLSVCALGLGFLWAALDEDRLTWHDLISRMYQRSY